MGCDERSTNQLTITRRRVLGGLGGTVAGGALAGCQRTGFGGATETTTDDGTVSFALTSPETGRYLGIGEAERRGFELALTHLNEGGGLVSTDAFESLSGDGVLGRTVEPVFKNTGDGASSVESELEQLLSNDEIAMFTGGIAGNVVRMLRDLADKYGVTYFAGTCPVDDITGENCSKYVYRELFSSTTIAAGIGPTLIEQYGTSALYYQVSIDAPESKDLQRAINGYFQSRPVRWVPVGNTVVRPGSMDFSSALTYVENSHPNVVVFNLFGLDAVNAIVQARKRLPEDVHIVVPLLNQYLADAIRGAVEHIIGALAWHPFRDTRYASTFTDAYKSKYGESSGVSGVAQNMYGQTLLYADAAARAGSFDPAAVRVNLENHEYRIGNGVERMRACDHQALRPVIVGEGLGATVDIGNFFALMNVATNVTPPCTAKPASQCSL